MRGAEFHIDSLGQLGTVIRNLHYGNRDAYKLTLFTAHAPDESYVTYSDVHAFLPQPPPPPPPTNDTDPPPPPPPTTRPTSSPGSTERSWRPLGC